MSCSSNCPVVPSCQSARCGVQQKGRSYKTIENFLKRMAFNLGNTASQTDLKIISCIPIDVTDLQQRITQLEKELKEAKDDKKRRDSKTEGEKENNKSRRGSKAKDVEDNNGKNNKSGRDSKAAAEDIEQNGKNNENGNDKEEKPEVAVQWMQRPKTTKNTNKTSHNYIDHYLNSGTNEIQSLFQTNKHKIYNETYKLNNTENSTVSSNVEDITSQHSNVRMKKQKHNPFSVLMGNMKKRKHTNVKCEQQQASHESCDSAPSSLSDTPMRKDKEEFSDFKRQGGKFQKFTNFKKKYKEKPSNLNDQYVYYAQTNTHFNPSYKNSQKNQECDMSFIANLVEKQYGPTGSSKDRGLYRQYSVPICHDKDYYSDDLEKYPISGFTTHSYCGEPNSRYNMNRILFGYSDVNNYDQEPAQGYKYYSKQNKGKFYDCTQYDIVPVKQKATKKYSEQPMYEGAPHRIKTRAPVRNSHSVISPPLNLHPSHSYQIFQNSNEGPKRHLYHSDSDRRPRRHEANSYVIKKKGYASRHAKKSNNKHKVYIHAEDIMFQPSDTRERNSTNKVDKKLKNETNSNEITEMKAILQNLIKEIKQDIPKLQEKQPEDSQVSPQLGKPTGNQCAYVTGFTPMMPTQQCCPILCPFNFLPEAHTNHCPTVCQLQKDPSACCVKITKSDLITPVNQDTLCETKKLIEEIYKSVALQNAYNECNIKSTNKDDKEKTGIDNEKLHTIKEPTIHCSNCLKNSASSSKIEHTMETDSKDQNLSYRTSSSTHTDSCMLYPREQTDVKIKEEKNGIFSNFMQALKLSFTKNREMDTRKQLMKNYKEITPYRQNDHKPRPPPDKLNANRTVDANNNPEYNYKHCCCDSEQSSSQYYHDRPSPSKYSSPKHLHTQNDARSYRHVSNEPKNCFYMSEPQQIPFCLKEIEVKNVSTQVKKKKLFGILRKLKHATNSDTERSFEQLPPRERARNPAASQRQMGYKKKKTGFLELLKGPTNFNYDSIYKHNLANDGSESEQMQPPQSSWFKPKQYTKKSGKWNKYMHNIEKAKKRDITHNMFYKNPLSFKNVIMKTLIGQKPVPNTKRARAFY